MTISSAVAMIGFADLGVGNGLMNAVAHAHGKDDKQDIKNKIAAGLLILSMIAIVILTIFIICYAYVPWSSLFNVKSQIALKESTPTTAIIVIFFALNIPSSIVMKVLMGLQMGFVANLWSTVCSLMVLVLNICVINIKGGLPFLAAATVAPPFVIAILAGGWFFYKQKPLLRPKLTDFKIANTRKLASTSGLFLALQLFGLIAFQSDNLIIAHYLGPNAVAVYSIAFRLFIIPGIILSLFSNAMWPAYAEAYSRGDNNWIYSAFRKSFSYSVAIILPLSFILLLTGKWIIEKWAGSSVIPSWNLLVGLFFWSILNVFGANFATILNGLGVIKFQVITSALMSIVNIILSLWLVQLVGVSGPIWGSVLSLTFIVYLPTIMYLRKYFKRAIYL